jgi:hypothetical protein
VKLTANRLEDAALSYRGEERVQLLHRWLVAFKETQRAGAGVQDPQAGDDPNQAAALLVNISACWLVSRAFLNCIAGSCGADACVLQDLYVDYESESEPMNFFHVFLYSQALECVVLSVVIWFFKCVDDDIYRYYHLISQICDSPSVNQILEAPTEEEVSLLSEIFG